MMAVLIGQEMAPKGEGMTVKRESGLWAWAKIIEGQP